MSKHLIRYLILMAVLLIGAGSSLGQLASSSTDYLGTPVYYSNTQHLPGMPLSSPNYAAPYGSPYYGSYGPFPYYNYYNTYPYNNYWNSYGGYLTSGFGLTGRVTDQAGNGLAGAQVILTNVYDSGSFQTTTNSQGFYGINAPDGVYYVTASLPGYAFTQQVGRLVSGFASPALNLVGYPAPGSMPATSPAAYGTSAAPASTIYNAPAVTTPPSTGYSSGYASSY